VHLVARAPRLVGASWVLMGPGVGVGVTQPAVPVYVALDELVNG
jgi:hypothetical protein